MKTLNILLSSLILITFSCKKKDDPTPDSANNSGKIELNYGSLVDFDFVPFTNPQSIPIDSLLKSEMAFFKLREYNVFQYTEFNFDSAIYNIQINTQNDEENITFETNWLAPNRPVESWRMTMNGKSEFGIVGDIPCKQIQTPVKGNGIIEYTGTDDFITTQYISKYTGNNIKTTLNID